MPGLARVTFDRFGARLQVDTWCDGLLTTVYGGASWAVNWTAAQTAEWDASDALTAAESALAADCLAAGLWRADGPFAWEAELT